MRKRNNIHSNNEHKLPEIRYFRFRFSALLSLLLVKERKRKR